MFARVTGLLILLTLFLLIMVGMKQWTLNTGTPVLLETQPIDPRSLFRGDFVRLNYTISNLEPASLLGDDEFKRHDPIYVELQQKDKYWHAKTIHRSRPSSNNLFITGKVERIRNFRWNPDTEKNDEIKTIHVKYGIENYFLPEGEGLDLERRDNDQIVDILVAIDTRGKAGIKEVLVDNEIRYIETLW